MTEALDIDELNRLFALIPAGPYHPIRSGDGYEVRQIDTDPTNKHHWSFRLCQSIAGQKAGCDDAVFAFIAGVLNAWPYLAAPHSGEPQTSIPLTANAAGVSEVTKSSPPLTETVEDKGLVATAPKAVYDECERQAHNLANLWADGLPAAKQAILVALLKAALTASQAECEMLKGEVERLRDFLSMAGRTAEMAIVEERKAKTENATLRKALEAIERVAGTRYFLTKCERCGWFGTSEDCPLSHNMGDADVVCPSCNRIFLCDEIEPDDIARSALSPNKPTPQAGEAE
jgi:hypothetical protein